MQADDREELRRLIDQGERWLALAYRKLDPGPDADAGWLVGGRRELTRALGKTGGYARYIERLAARGELEIRPDSRPDRLAIRLHDPARQARTRALLERGRAVRGRQPV